MQIVVIYLDGGMLSRVVYIFSTVLFIVIVTNKQFYSFILFIHRDVNFKISESWTGRDVKYTRLTNPESQVALAGLPRAQG